MGELELKGKGEGLWEYFAQGINAVCSAPYKQPCKAVGERTGVWEASEAGNREADPGPIKRSSSETAQACPEAAAAKTLRSCPDESHTPVLEKYDRPKGAGEGRGRREGWHCGLRGGGWSDVLARIKAVKSM